MAEANAAFEFSEEPPGVDERIRRFRLQDEVDTFAIRSRRLLVVVDTMSTPADARRLRAALEPDLDGRTLLVVDTHADYDHAWGNQVFADVPIVGHAVCGARLHGAAAYEDLERWKAQMPGRFDEVEPTAPSILFGDAGLVLDGGERALQAAASGATTARNFQYDARADLELSRLLAALDDRAAEKPGILDAETGGDRKSTRLNSSH